MVQERGYVKKEGRSLRPESRGRVLMAFLQAYFPIYVEYGFTASLEDELDGVSSESNLHSLYAALITLVLSNRSCFKAHPLIDRI